MAGCRGRVPPQVLALVVLVTSACKLPLLPGNFPIFRHNPALPSTAGITRLPDLKAIALYRFVDRRGQEPTLVGESGDGFPVWVRRAVDELVTEGFRVAFEARGFPVVDKTATPFSPGVIVPDGPFAVSGDVVLYFVQAGTYRRPYVQATCEVVLRVFRGDARVPVFERSYSGAGTSLSAALSYLVWQAVTDPELMKSLR